VSLTPSCRVCGKNDDVGCYPDDHSQTICVVCCPRAEHADGETGHQFDWEPGDGWMCRYCGIRRSDTDYDYSEDWL
jgi:hypothetical protein